MPDLNQLDAQIMDSLWEYARAESWGYAADVRRNRPRWYVRAPLGDTQLAAAGETEVVGVELVELGGSARLQATAKPYAQVIPTPALVTKLADRLRERRGLTVELAGAVDPSGRVLTVETEQDNEDSP